MKNLITAAILLLTAPAFATRAVMENVATTGNSLFVSSTAARVGVNNVAPAYTLDVTGQVNATSGFIGSLTGTASNVTTNANLTGPITSVGNATSVNSQTGSGSTFVMNTGSTMTATTLTGGTSFPSGIWNSAGQVGIGTTSPDSSLQLNLGAVISTMTIGNNSDGSGAIILHANSANPGGLYLGTPPNGARINYTASGNLSITPRSGYNTVFTGGNVGIGTTSPIGALDVVGTVRIETSHSGSVLCFLNAQGDIGHCTSVVGVGGACTCAAN